MAKKTFNLQIEENEQGLSIQADIKGFDPITVIGLLELQKSEIVQDMLNQNERIVKPQFAPKDTSVN